MSGADTHSAGYVVGRVFERLTQLAVAYGLSPGPMFVAAGLEPGPIPERVPTARVMDAVEWLMRRVRDPSMPLRVAELVPLETLQVAGSSIPNRPTLREALERLARYRGLLTNTISVSTAPDPAGALVRIDRAEAPRLGKRLALEAHVILMVGLGRALTEGPRWDPLRVSFPHPLPAAARHATYLRCPVAVVPGPATVLLAHGVLERRMARADAALLAFFDAHAQDLLAQAPTSPAATVTAQARAALGELLEGGAPTAADLAQHLNMSRRTLYRRLADEGTAFGALLDDLRRERACRLLRTSDTPLAEIAFALGFSDARAFHRAFKRWMGTTPGAYRSAPGLS